MPEEKNNIRLDVFTEQIGEIKVHSQIINDLSSGIYSSPASCIKELVNNSFDADANNVIIRMKPIEDTITLLDDGIGMNAEDFDQNFAWISKSNKRNRGELSPMGRPLIGKIGIGFIAVNEICEKLIIISSKKGEPLRFTATIDFSKIINSDPTKGADEDIYLKGEFVLINEEEDKNEHYTSIRLIGLKEPVLKIFNDETYKAQVAKLQKGFSKTAFKSMKEVLMYHSNKSVYSWENDTEYVQFIIDLASYIPVEYIDGGPIEGVNDKIINSIVETHKDFKFRVDFDGMYLKKPIFFKKEKITRREHLSFEHEIKIEESSEVINVKGYFYIQNSLLIPRELNGLAIRIKNIPIAERFGFDTTFMRYPLYMDQLLKNWVSGEIYIKNGLEDAMNIDRKSFRVTHPHYLALQDFVHKYFKENVLKTAHKIYEGGVDIRQDVKEKEKDEKTKEILQTKKITYQVKAKNTQDAKFTSPLQVLKNKDETIIEVNATSKNKFKKSDWDYLETIFIIFEDAFKRARGNTDKLREIFYTEIQKWKAKN